MNHRAHKECTSAFHRAREEAAFCAVHTLAETYSVVTRLPVRPASSSEQGLLFLDSLADRVTTVAESPVAGSTTR